MNPASPRINEVERACADLTRDRLPITFVALAESTGIARSTLYRNPDLRAVIEHHRRTQPDATITAITDELATLRTAVQTLADTVRNHETQIRQLARE